MTSLIAPTVPTKREEQLGLDTTHLNLTPGISSSGPAPSFELELLPPAAGMGPTMVTPLPAANGGNATAGSASGTGGAVLAAVAAASVTAALVALAVAAWTLHLWLRKRRCWREMLQGIKEDRQLEGVDDLSAYREMCPGMHVRHVGLEVGTAQGDQERRVQHYPPQMDSKPSLETPSSCASPHGKEGSPLWETRPTRESEDDVAEGADPQGLAGSTGAGEAHGGAPRPAQRKHT